MLFNSFAYAIFFPSTVALYFAIPHRWRWAWLLGASCLFYLAFIPAFIAILAFTIVIDYGSGLLIEQASGGSRKAFLAASLVSNVLVLGTFKYFNFASETLTLLLGHLGIQVNLPLLTMVLPIGLSFHTFQSMSYTIEVYRGHIRAERHFGIFALYVMFFPQLVAGPIERPQNLLEQFRTPVTFNYDRAISGLQLMIWGLLKKVVIADSIATAVDRAFNAPSTCSASALVLAVYLFAIQIYCDFSGYSDIAIGSAQILGIRLMTNFERPYAADSLPDFWRRWHISLSTWFRDYVYVPLGGNRRHRLRNLLVVFLVSGLWHGANWTFVVWGGLHAAFMIVSTKRRPGTAIPSRRIARIAHVVLTFHLVALAWIFFRAATVPQALSFIARIGHAPFFSSDPLQELGLPRFQRLIVGTSLLFLAMNEFSRRPRFLFEWFKERPLVIRWGVYYAAILAIVLTSGGGPRQFIYFQF